MPNDSVIDLDEAAGERGSEPTVAPSGLSRLAAVRVSFFRVVALVLAGALTGAAAMLVWVDARQRDQLASEVSLFVFVAGFESAGGVGGRLVTIQGSLAVVNGGATPVEVSGTGTDKAFMLEGRQEIGPDETGWFSVRAEVSCSSGFANSPLPVEFSVLTVDQRRTTVTVDLHVVGSRWYEVLLDACRRPPTSTG